LVNLLIGGGIGLIVDAASGANFNYPDVLKLPMEPIKSAPESKKNATKKH
jgi:hypothetical protein